MKFIFITILLVLVTPLQARECPRIISQSPYITHSLKWLGLEQCIVGVSRYDTMKLPHTGGILDPDTAAIDSLMADIIFTANWISEDKMKQAMPKDIKFYRLNGFDSLSEIHDNLLRIGHITGQQDIDEKVRQFEKELNKRIQQIKPNTKKALLLSSCSGTPYSFGKRTWLYDLFDQIGFSMVETHDKIRHIRPGKEIEEITTLLNTLQPDILFIFDRKLNSKCNLILPKVPIKIVTLDGRHFLHPAPVLLKGLDELDKKQSLWH